MKASKSPRALPWRWIAVNRIPAEHRRSVIEQPGPPAGLLTVDDEHRPASLKHYRSLVPLAREASKPVFESSVADGAIGSHALAVREAYADIRLLAHTLLERSGLMA